SSRRRHTRLQGDWSSDVCSSDLHPSAKSKELTAMNVRTFIAVNSFDFADGCRRLRGNPRASLLPRNECVNDFMELSVGTASGSRSEERRVWKEGMDCGRAYLQNK